jgi:hypothetical protein
VITPEQVLIATPEELRRWCGLLQYGEAREMWVTVRPDGGYLCNILPDPESTREPCAKVLRHWQPLPRYTESLDAICPLQERAVAVNSIKGYYGRCLYMVTLGGEELPSVTELCGMILLEVVATAGAEDRARAVCLTLLDELNGLLEEEK